MSELLHKARFQLHIPQLDGKTLGEALGYFKTILGEPEEIDEWEGEVEYFSYGGPRKGEGYNVAFDSGKYFLVYNLYCNEYDYSLSLTLEEMEERAKEIANKAGLDKNNVKLKVYTWYTGSDEPLED